jgi:predicted XRE-type DNA-binding protein
MDAMPNDIRPRKCVRPYIEDGTLSHTEAARIIDWEQPTVSQHINGVIDGGWDEPVNVDRNAVLDLVEQGTLTQSEAADILDCGQPAISHAMNRR